MSALSGNTNSHKVNHSVLPCRCARGFRRGPAASPGMSDEHLDVLGDLQLGVSVQDGEWPSAAVAARGLDEWACPGAAEADCDRGEHDHGEHTRAQEGRGVLGQHRPGVETDFGQRDEQREGGRGQQHQLDSLTHREIAPIEQQCGEAAYHEEQDEEDE